MLFNVLKCVVLNISLKRKALREALEKIYISQIRSMIEYGNVLYDNCPKYLSDRLESVQLDAVRVRPGI